MSFRFPNLYFISLFGLSCFAALPSVAASSCQKVFQTAQAVCSVNEQGARDSRYAQHVRQLKEKQTKLTHQAQEKSTQISDKKSGANAGANEAKGFLQDVEKFNSDLGEICAQAKSDCDRSCAKPEDVQVLNQCRRVPDQKLSEQGLQASNLVPSADQTAQATSPGGASANSDGAGAASTGAGGGGGNGQGEKGGGGSALAGALPLLALPFIMKSAKDKNGTTKTVGNKNSYVNNPQRINPGINPGGALSAGAESGSGVDNSRTIASMGEEKIRAAQESMVIQRLRQKRLVENVKLRVLAMIRNFELEQAYQEIEGLLAGNDSEVNIANETLMPALDSKLAEIGLPGGALGVSLVNEKLSPGRDSNVVLDY